MNPNFIIIQAAISVGGAFLAAHLAMKKFRSEKWWEKKAAAYAELVEALHTMKWRASEHLERIISEEEKSGMREEFELARRNIWRIADGSGFFISDEVTKAVDEMEQELIKAKNAESEFEYLNEEYAAINKCLLRIKEIGKTDLGG